MWLFHGCDPSLTFLTAKGNSRDSGKQAGATAATGPRPGNANETMLAALLVATHGSAMGELARSCAALMEAIDRHGGRDGQRRA